MTSTDKRIAAIIAVLAIILIVLLIIAGCGKSDEKYYFTEEGSPRFTVIERGADYTIAVDTQTGVEYLWTEKGNVITLIDHEGRPYLANGWRDAGRRRADGAILERYRRIRGG